MFAPPRFDSMETISTASSANPMGTGALPLPVPYIVEEPHHSVTAIPTVSAAVHHSAYLIAIDEANGGTARFAAVKEVSTAVGEGVPDAAIGKCTVGVPRHPHVSRAKVGVPCREYPNDNAL